MRMSEQMAVTLMMMTIMVDFDTVNTGFYGVESLAVRMMW
jgi:hypothetical protein